jgi:7-cyano-7-deazaguanine reductase
MKKKSKNSDFQPLDRRYDVQGLKAIDASVLDTFPYEYPERGQQIHIETGEFTAVCPFSGLPDFATIKIDYIPDRQIIELRSFKYYLLSYRNVGIYQEHVVNKILEDLVASCKPKRMQVTADYKVRGGVHTVCSVEYKQKRRP